MSLISRDFLSKFWRLLVPWVQINLFHKRKQKLLVHTPGKVASTSVYKTLKKRLAKTHNVFHFHYISPKGITLMVEKNLNSERKSLPLHLVLSQAFARRFDPKSENLQMIVLIREPISRYISSTFQNLNMYFKNPRKVSLERVEQIILQGLNKGEHLSELYWWFDQELKVHLGIDVFRDEHLVHNKGYWHFKRDNVQVYVLKMEDISDIFTQFCQNELRLENLVLIDSNVASNKSYSNLYRQLKKTITIPSEVNKTTNQSKYMRRFY